VLGNKGDSHCVKQRDKGLLLLDSLGNQDVANGGCEGRGGGDGEPLGERGVGERGRSIRSQAGKKKVLAYLENTNCPQGGGGLPAGRG